MVADPGMVRRVERLWRKVQSVAEDVKAYSDDEWCEDYAADEYLAYILTWAGWKPERQSAEWKRVRSALGSRRLHELGDNAVRFSLPWQNAWLSRLVKHLRTNGITAEGFVEVLKSMSHRNAKRTLQRIVGTSEEKIIECWLRDIVRMEAFPIDSRVRGVLRRHSITDDSELLVETSRGLGIPVRDFARAVYSNADRL